MSGLRARVSVALEQGLDLPKGPLLVMRPDPRAALPELPEMRILTTDRVAWEAFEALGYSLCTQPAAPVPAALVVIPRSKKLARAMVAEASRCATGLVMVDGQKTDGVDGLFRECRRLIPDVQSVTKAHGRIFWFAPQPVFDTWTDPGPRPDEAGWQSAIGTYGEGKIDAGSALLAAALPTALPSHVVDLGAGWGYLADAILARKGVEQLDLVETEARALDAARLNIPDPRAVFHWADALTWTPETPVGAVVMNPPFHQGRTGRPDLGCDFITAAARMLTPRGSLWMVANRHLPYEETLRDRFHHVEELPGSGAFKLFHASRPNR